MRSGGITAIISTFQEVEWSTVRHVYLLDPIGSLDIGKMSGCLYVCVLPKPPI